MKMQQEEGQQILIVDDKPKNLQVIGTILRENGYLFSIARNGKKALEIIKQNPPDLILLDIMMDEMDGFETCRHLKNDPDTLDIPVIFLSALADIESKVKGFTIGAADYVTKPFQAEEVLARVKTHLALYSLQKRLEEKNALLQEALDNNKTLKGMLPICSRCKKIRDDEGYWNQIEKYVEDHSDALFSHGICPVCMEVMYGDDEWFKKISKK